MLEGLQLDGFSFPARAAAKAAAKAVKGSAAATVAVSIRNLCQFSPSGKRDICQSLLDSAFANHEVHGFPILLDCHLCSRPYIFQQTVLLDCFCGRAAPPDTQRLAVTL